MKEAEDCPGQITGGLLLLDNNHHTNFDIDMKKRNKERKKSATRGIKSEQHVRLVQLRIATDGRSKSSEQIDNLLWSLFAKIRKKDVKLANHN